MLGSSQWETQDKNAGRAKIKVRMPGIIRLQFFVAGVTLCLMDTIEYTTAEVAKACVVGKMYLLRLIWSGKLPEVRIAKFGAVKFRFWSEPDLLRAQVLVAQLRAEKALKGRAGKGSKEATKCQPNE
jgi:hypothetical protein